MKTRQQNIYSLRLPEEHMEKLRYVAKENGRSVNKEIEILVKAHIEDFERKKGIIPLAPSE